MTRDELDEHLEDEQFRESVLEMQEDMGFSREETLEALDEETFRDALAEMYTDLELAQEDREQGWT